MAMTGTQRFDEDRADRVCRFFEQGLVHTKGRWARRPFILTPWQRDEIIRPLFGTVRYDDQLEEWVRQYTLAWIELARKNGKMLKVGTPVPTTAGWRRIEELSTSDRVFAPDGSPVRVKWVSVVHQRPGYRVRFADGAELVAGDTHRWVVNDRIRRGERVVDTAELAATLTYGAREDRRYTLTVPEAVWGDERWEPELDPWTLGYWLANGHSYSGQVTTGGANDEDDLEPVMSELRRAGFAPIVRARKGELSADVNVPGLHAILVRLGLLKNKHIPEMYLFAGERHRRRLLAGLLDGDGSAMVNRRQASSGRVEYSSISERLAADVVALVRSLGWKATIHEGAARLNGVDHGRRYRVSFHAYADEAPFTLARKNSRLPGRPEKAPRSRTNAVASVEPVGMISGACIAVAHPSHAFLAGKSFTPTHNSELVAGCGLYLLCADGEEEAEIFGCAKDKDQAGVVYRVAKRMVELSPLLSKQVAKGRLEVIDSQKRIVYKPTGSFYQVVAADGSGNLGSNPHGVLFDEVITQPNRELWDALKTGMGTRDQPLMLAATTAGNDPSSMAAEEHLHSESVLADPSLDPARFVFMRNTPMDADWKDEASWAHANPGLGDFLRIQILRDEALEAARSPRKQNAFRQFRLNQWVRQITRWLDMGLWDENASIVVEETLRGRRCFAGLDMASTSDFAAWVLFFPQAVPDASGITRDAVVARFWLPGDALNERRDMRDVIEHWARTPALTITPGAVIDHDAIKRQVDADLRAYRVQKLGYDRWGANELVQWATKRGLECIGVPQTTTALNAPSKELERLLGRRQLAHGGNPVLRWMADNVQALTDSNGNIKPDRKRSKEKIDGIIGLVNALFVASEAPKEAFAFVL